MTNSKLTVRLLLVFSLFVVCLSRPEHFLVETEDSEEDDGEPNLPKKDDGEPKHLSKKDDKGLKVKVKDILESVTNGAGDDYSFLSSLITPDLMKSVIPQNIGAAFDMAEGILPGTKALQGPVEKTWGLIHPILKVSR